jgi:hypothetical protein
MYVKEIGPDGVEWIQVAHSTNKWRVLVNNWVSVKAGDFFNT